MNTKQQNGVRPPGNIVSRYRDREIQENFLADGASYECDKQRGYSAHSRFDLEQARSGEAFLNSCLAYKDAEEQEQSQKSQLHLSRTESTNSAVLQEAVNSSHAPLSKVLGKLIGVYAFHWWRVATLRPEFRLLSDLKVNVFAFVFLYLSLGLVNWALLAEKSLTVTLANFGFSMALTLALTVRPKQSFSLSASFFAAGAAIELLILIASVLGVTFVSDWFYIFIEVLMYVTSLRAFHHAPVEVRKRGYKYQGNNT